MGTAMMRVGKIYGKGPVPVGKTHFYENIVLRDERDPYIPGTKVKRLRLHNIYDALAYCKHRQWITGGGLGVPYRLNEDGSWKPPSISAGEATGEPLSRDQLEYLVDAKTQQVEEMQRKLAQLCDWSNGSDDANGANVALSSLMKIVGDSGASTRQRIKASAAILNYRTQQSDIAEFVKKYLQSVCESTDNVDYRIEAGELLRRHEAPRVTPDSVRPAYREENAEPREPPIPLLELVRQRRERADRMQAELIRQYGWRDNSSGGDGGDQSSD